MTPGDPGPGPILTVSLNLGRQAPASSSFPSYVQPEREQQAGTQWDALTGGAVEHMRKVYGTLATGIGIAAGASLFTMATPLVGALPPLVTGLAPIAPLLGLYYTNKHTHSMMFRTGLFAAFTGLSGVATGYPRSRLSDHTRGRGRRRRAEGAAEVIASGQPKRPHVKP